MQLKYEMIFHPRYCYNQLTYLPNTITFFKCFLQNISPDINKKVDFVRL